jgi:asparagine synthase (glutamine-hydrolysing)
MEGWLPDSVMWRKKSPYPKTYDPKYLMLVNHRLQTIMEEDDAPILQLVDRSALENLLISEYEWPWYGQLMKVPQTIAYMLQIDYWLRRYQVTLA